MGLWSDTPAAAKVGVVAGLIPFIISIHSTSTMSGPSGTTCSHMDFVALIGGAIALLAAFALLRPSREAAMGPRPPAGLRYGSAAVVLALGVIQVLAGIGVLFSPCP